MDGITALDRSFEWMGDVVKNVGSGQFGDRTPCGQWDVKEVLNHALGAATMFTLVNEGTSGAEDAGDLVGDDAVGAIAAIRSSNVGSWRGPGALDGDKTYPFGTFPATAGLMINVGEILLHGWDVAKATGQSTKMDPEVCELLYGFYRQVPAEILRADHVFGPEVEVADGASPTERLLGWLGRQP